jgi:hypothetical protein
MITGLVADVTVTDTGKPGDFFKTVAPLVVNVMVLAVPSPYSSRVALPI